MCAGSGGPHDRMTTAGKHAAALMAVRRLRAAGFEALFAGGCVRDMLLGVAPKDFDVATSARPDDVIALFEHTVAVGRAFGVIRVRIGDCFVETATFREDGPYADGRHPDRVTFSDAERDANRRDFTINAMFYDPESDRLLDYVGGEADLRAGILRAVGDPERRFREDHLRQLRALRFAARLGFEIEPATWSALTRLAPLCGQTSAERIRDELLLMLTEGRARQAFELLDKTGMLARLLPEIDRLHGVAQPPEFHPEGDVWVHTLLLLEQLPPGCSPTLALAALLHDIGKPDTQTHDDRIRFNDHDTLGADMTRAICERLRLPRSTTDRVVWLVRNHMRLAHMPRMRESKRRRFAREPGFAELVTLCTLDIRASHGRLDLIDWIATYIEEVPEEQRRPERLITGRDLIALGYAPGPRFTEILSAIEDAQLEGRIRTREDAIAMARRMWPVA